MKKYFSLFLCLLLLACKPKVRADDEIYIGTIAGPETELMQTIADVAWDKYQIKVKVIEFEDYILPNSALAEGTIDANMFQHKPYLEAAMHERGFKFAILANTFIYPMGLYSNKIKNLNEIKENAIVALPNDPSNAARALLLLEKAGLIKLDAIDLINASTKNITSNPMHLKFKELDAASLPRALPDVTIAAINTNYAIPAGLSPSNDAVFLEDKDSPYANIIVVRADEISKNKFQKLKMVLRDASITAKAKTLFGDSAILYQ